MGLPARTIHLAAVKPPTAQECGRWAALRVLGVLIALGCASDQPGDGFAVRDSAGIRTVANVSPLWSRAGGWLVDTAPAVEIGIQDGPEPYQFYRIGGVLRLTDGTIVVTNAGSGEIRFYAPTGEHLRSVGRHGAGPGEFGEFSSMPLWEGSDGRLVVWDSHNRRVNEFAADGGFLRTVQLAPLPAAPRGFLLGIFGDGTRLCWGPLGGGVLSGAPGTLIESEFAYWRADSTGSPLNRIMQAPGRPRLVHQFAGVTRYPYVPLTVEPQAAAAPQGFLLLLEGRPPLYRYAPGGELHAVIHWPGPPAVATDDVWPAFVDEELGSINDPNDQRWYRDYYSQRLPLPEVAPQYDELITDTVGNVWLRRYRVPGVARPLWDVLDSAGRWLGAVEMPYRLRLLEIGAGYVLGRHLDSLGVERIRLYHLTKR